MLGVFEEALLSRPSSIEECRELTSTLSQLLAELAAARSATKLSEEVLAVATAFQTLLPFLKLYALYCSGYFAALETLERVKTERPPVASAVAAAETALAVHRQGEGDLRLASCLIRPVKRLCLSLYPEAD